MIKKVFLDCNVVEATKLRLKNIFSAGVKINLSLSGGKDSLVLADNIYKLCVSGEIDKTLLKVLFVDEEAIYDEVIEICKVWRKKFMLIGVPFDWYCIEIRNNNCLDSLSETQGIIAWDVRNKDKWLRPMPEFAITTHPLLKPREDSYQDFLQRVDNYEGSISLIGVRASESVQRLKYLAQMKTQLAAGTRMFPIYDWTDKDVWLYLLRNNIDIPQAYINLYSVGTPINRLRLTEFFAIDSVKCLVNLNEIYPKLMDKVVAREPNAYLVALYWDTGMFRRTTKKRKEMEEGQESINYRNKMFELMKNPESLPMEHQRDLLKLYKQTIIKFGFWLNDSMYRRIYESILAGDLKKRTYRAIFGDIIRSQGVGGWKKK